MVLRPSASLHRRILANWREAGRRLVTHQAGATLAITRKLQSLMVEGRHFHQICGSTQLQKPMLSRQSQEKFQGTFSDQSEQRDDLLKKSPEQENWIAVYRYPGIRLAVLIARAKVIQTVASVLFLPYSFYQFSMGHFDTVFFYSSALLAIIAPVTLAIFSRYLNRLVGVISMNESNDSVRVGYLTFWGSRKNKYLDIADVLPLNEVVGNKNDTLVKFSWFGGSSFLYLPIKNVEILDQERAKILFGDLSFFRRP